MSSIEAVGLCSQGHDLAVLGRTGQRQCRACMRASWVRYAQTEKGRANSAAQRARPSYLVKQERYARTVKGIRTTLRYGIKEKIARIAELERELNAYA